MRVWLDDLRDPRDPQIQKKFGAQGDEIWVKSPLDAIDLLLTGSVTSISLDNDLGEPPFENVLPRPGGVPLTNHPSADMREGYSVADWIEEQAFHGSLPACEVKAHSANPVASERMRVAIRNAYRYWARSSKG